MSWVNLDLQRWLHKIATYKKSRYFKIWSFLFCAVFALANNASAFTGTLNFSGADTSLGSSVTDGEANSTDIAGVVIEIYSASAGGNTNNSAPWGYNDDLFGFGAGGDDEGILDESGNGSPVIVIRTQGGADFSFTGIKIVDYFGVHGSIKFEAFRDGSSVGSVTLSTDGGDFISDFNQSNGLTASIFQNVDEVRITDTNPANNIYIGLDNIGFANAVIPAPTVTDAKISISGASGTGGAFKIGDTVTATWNNTVGTGDNNSGISSVTVDFSQFGGGAAVVASNSSNTWTATYIITSGSIDLTNRNVSVTATNPGGSTTTADTTNATVDNIAPTVTDGRISISGATGTSGAFKIGDTVTATWNNTAGGDNNSDTISSVTVNFTDFGGGAAVSASNSSGTWTATYIIVAGSVDLTNRNVTVTARDNAGNTTATGDSTNATVDNIAPTVSSIAPAGGAVSSDTTVGFVVDFSEAVSNVSTDDFDLTPTGSVAGTIASVSASSGDPITVTVGAISGSGTLKVNLKASTNIVDDVGNSIAAYSSGTTHTVNILTAPGAPTIGSAVAGDGQVSVSFTAPVSNGGSAITGYTVTSNPGGITGGGNGFTTSPITVTGLTNGQAYTFTVTATNSVGTSTASGASGSATPKAVQTITFANPGSQNFGTTPTLSATSTSSLTVTFSSSTTGVCTITPGGALTFVTAGTCTIDADQGGNASTNAAPTVSRTFTVNAVVPSAPTIGTATAGDTQADISFTAPASNGGATITGYTVTSNPGGFTGTGAGSPITVTSLTNGVSYTFTVTATNSVGTGNASAASNSVTPASPQVITFANPGAQSFGTSPDLGAGVSSSSGLTVAFTSSTTAVCTITSAGVLTFVSTGTCTVNANQAGDSTYLPAPQVTRSFTVNPATQTITFTNPGAQNFGSSPTLSASSTSGLTVTFSSSTTGVCIITSGGVLTFVTAGSCTIDADQAGNATTNAAMTVSRTFSVNAIVPGAPTIGTATAGDTQADVSFTAPASNGGATITGYTVTSNPGGFTGTGAVSPITVTGLTNGVSYTFTVTATNSAGTGGASGVSNSITPASPQTITFANPGAQSYGTAPNLSTLGGGVSSTSGLTVTFTSSTTGVCTITSGGVLTFVTVGTCTINANQGGNSSFLPAPQVSRSFIVNPVVPDAPTSAVATAGDTQVSVAFVAPANAGGSPITGYTVTPNPLDVAPVSGASSPIVVTGLTNGVAYTFTVTADNVAGTGLASIASNSVTPKATQTITFVNPGPQNFGATPTFSATSDSGLIPTFTSSTTGVCTITSGGAVTFVTAGTCTINADQPGNGSYLAATQVTRSFAVNAVAPGTPTIGTASAGNSQATVTFTAPASTGGAAITSYTVTASPGGATASGAGSPITISGLTNGISYTFTVTATNSVGTGAPSAASNSVTPSVPPNNAPVIAQGSSTSVTMSEDGVPTPFSLTLSASDSDGDTLTWSVSTAAHGSVSVSGGSVSYTPVANYNGSDSFTVQVSDASASASITVNVTITPVNDLPVISGTASTSLNQDTAYSFTPTASDLDVGDVLTFSITNKPTWASFSTTTGALTGTPAGTDAGKTTGIVISVSDGTASVALPAFDIEVISTVDPLLPIVTAPATLDVNATALFTPITLRQLLGISSGASQSEINAALKALAKDGVTGNDCCTTSVEGLTATNSLLLAPGRHELKWKAVNAVGVSGEATQIVNINPLVSLSKSQIAVRGSNVEFRVLLNGPAPTYPLSIPYVIDASTTATAAEHNLTSGTATFTGAGQVEVAIPVALAAVTGFSDSQLVVALGSGINAGAANRHVIDIRQGNVPPVVSLSVSQGGITTNLITPGGGPVTITATVVDPNKDDTHTFMWIGTGLTGDASSTVRTLDPSGLTGSKQIQIIVTDSGGAIVQASAYFRIVSALPVLDVNTDTDQDGISDAVEGTSDSDDNGIPDYLDNMPSSNILPQQGNTTNAYLIECDPGVRCGLGLFARGGNSGGVQILDNEVSTLPDLIVDPAFEPVGGVFDFAIRDLPTPGQSVRVVIPQRAAVPANAVYRKFQQGRWVSFVTDADNAIHSAAGNPGYCPPPGSSEWTPGLTAGHLCVQLTIEDGGPNDDDGQVNSAVVDPGAVSEAKPVEPEPPEPPEPKPPVEVKSKGSGSVGELWILLLGGLLMIKRNSSKIVALAVALVAANSQAGTDTNKIYLGVEVYSVESSQTESDFTHALAAEGHKFTIERYDEDRTGYQIAAGYDWNSFTYTQIGYLDLGDVNVDLLVDGDADLAAFAQDFGREYPITAKGVNLVQGLRFSLGDKVSIAADAGVFFWEAETEVNNVPFVLPDDSGADPVAGIKLELPLNDHLGLNVGLRRIFFNKQEVDLYAFGSSFRF